MSPKKNAFFAFVTEYQKEQMIDQNISFSFQQLADKLTPIWNSMSDNEKNKYKIFADKLNSKRKEKKNPEQIITLHNNSSDYWKMKEYLENMFESISEEELLNTKFILLHVNCHAHEAEKYYFPAEIAALKFNLSKGVLHTYHQIVGLANNYPRGFAGGMREYSDKFHQIDCWDKNHPENYKKILSDFINFLKDEEISDLNDSTLDLPCMFTVETEIGLDMMKTKNSLERLYQTVFPEHDLLNYKSIFKIGSVERLLFEITKKTKMNLDSRSIITGLTTHDILKTGLYGYGLGCTYHEGRNIAFQCSKARVLQWMSNICKYVGEFIGLQLIPGRHIAVQLKDGSRMVKPSNQIRNNTYC